MDKMKMSQTQQNENVTIKQLGHAMLNLTRKKLIKLDY